jgi:hypothetical protein
MEHWLSVVFHQSMHWQRTRVSILRGSCPGRVPPRTTRSSGRGTRSLRNNFFSSTVCPGIPGKCAASPRYSLHRQTSHRVSQSDPTQTIKECRVSVPVPAQTNLAYKRHTCMQGSNQTHPLQYLYIPWGKEALNIPWVARAKRHENLPPSNPPDF